MKKIRNFFKVCSLKATLFAASFLLPAVSAFADKPADAKTAGTGIINDFGNSLAGVGTALVGLLTLVIYIIGGIVLATNIGSAFKGDREAGQKVAWWVAAIVVSSVLLGWLASKMTYSAS